MRVGNFSVIPRPLLPRLVGVSDLWNHYAAAVFKSRLPYATVPTRRGRRYAGRSHMNVVALTMHGLSAMAAFGDRIGVRLLAALNAIAAVLIGVVLADSRLPRPVLSRFASWAPVAIAILVVLQAFGIGLAFVFIILSGRENSTFLPLRDYGYILTSSTSWGRSMDQYRYVGEELGVFAHAVNWKDYVRSLIDDALAGDMLEVGAGIGTATLAWRSPPAKDLDLPRAGSATRDDHRRPITPAIPPCSSIHGTTRDLGAEGTLTTVLCMTSWSTSKMTRRNSRGPRQFWRRGRLIVLSPAHQWLYTAFDRRIGHFRRYTRRSSPPWRRLDSCVTVALSRRSRRPSIGREPVGCIPTHPQSDRFARGTVGSFRSHDT